MNGTDAASRTEQLKNGSLIGGLCLCGAVVQDGGPLRTGADVASLSSRHVMPFHVKRGGRCVNMDGGLQTISPFNNPDRLRVLQSERFVGLWGNASTVNLSICDQTGG